MIKRMDKTFMFVGALMGGIGVAIGAFGAHGLRGRLSPEMLAVFETGVRYHMYHAPPPPRPAGRTPAAKVPPKAPATKAPAPKR